MVFAVGLLLQLALVTTSPSLPYMDGIRIRIRFIWVMYSCLARVVASRAQWMFGIFAVGLQMAIKLNQLKSKHKCKIFLILFMIALHLGASIWLSCKGRYQLTSARSDWTHY